MKEWLSGVIASRKVQAALLVLAGFALTAWLGVRAASDEPPDGVESLLLVLLAGFFQVAGASVFSRIGRADPSLARTAVRKLVNASVRAEAAEQAAQNAYEQGNVKELRETMGQLSVHLSYLRESAITAIEEWQEFHSDALRDVLEEKQQ